MKKCIITLLLLFLVQNSKPMTRRLASTVVGLKSLLSRMVLNSGNSRAILGARYNSTFSSDKDCQKIKKYQCENCGFAVGCPTFRRANELALITNKIDPSQREIKLEDAFQAIKSLSIGLPAALCAINISMSDGLPPAIVPAWISYVFLKRGIDCLSKANDAWRLGNSLRKAISYSRINSMSTSFNAGLAFGNAISHRQGDSLANVIVPAASAMYTHSHQDELDDYRCQECYRVQDELNVIVDNLSAIENKDRRRQDFEKLKQMHLEILKFPKNEWSGKTWARLIECRDSMNHAQIVDLYNEIEEKKADIIFDKFMHHASSMSESERQKLYYELIRAYHPANTSSDLAAERLKVVDDLYKKSQNK